MVKSIPQISGPAMFEKEEHDVWEMGGGSPLKLVFFNRSGAPVIILIFLKNFDIKEILY
jgi:hypothetical protein